MKNLILIFILIFVMRGEAFAADFIKCVAETDSYKASVAINTNGTGLFKLLKKGAKEESICALKLSIFSDKRKAVIPQIRAELERNDCVFAADTKSDEVLNSLVLQLDVYNNGKNKSGIMQWSGSNQPDDCKVEELDLDSVQHYSKRWQQGNWGRKPASLKGVKAERKNRN